MAEDKKLSQLIINEMTKAQYDALPTINEDEIYVITDAETAVKTDNTTIVGDGTSANPIAISSELLSKIDGEIENRTEKDEELEQSISDLKTIVDDHIADKDNPHEVTKVHVGLSNVDNTSDANKPVSTAQQAALDLKADKATTYTKTETDGAIETALEEYVKFTDYSGQDKAGVIKTSSGLGMAISATGYPLAVTATKSEYDSANTTYFIGKGTLENIKDDYVKRGLTENSLTFTEEEQTAARTLIDAVGPNDYATSTEGGTVLVKSGYGIGHNTTAGLYTVQASEAAIDEKANQYTPITPKVLDYAVKVGVTTNTITLTDEEKTNVRNWIEASSQADITTINQNISTIEGKIPATASTSNLLADRNFVTSSIQQSVASFRGSWKTYDDVPTSPSAYPVDFAGVTTPSVNDYLIVQDASDYFVSNSKNLLDTDCEAISTNNTPDSAVLVDFGVWYTGVAYNGYMGTTSVPANLLTSDKGTVSFTSNSYGSYGIAKFVQLKPNTTYVLSSKTTVTKCAITNCTSESNGYYKFSTNVVTPKALPITFTTDETAVCAIVLYADQNGVEKTYEELQLEEGNLITPYEPAGGYYLEGTWRFKYVGTWSTDGKTGWKNEYQIDEKPLTDEQVDALNSGINETLVSQYNEHIDSTSNPHNVTKAQIGLSNVDNTSDMNKPISTATQTALNAITDDLSSHVSNVENPHNVTKAQVGLGNVNNTSDIDKPVSTAQQTAIDTAKKVATDHIADKNNPHSVTKAQIGLGNVDNTSDLNKPISTATQTALNLKANAADVYTKTETEENAVFYTKEQALTVEQQALARANIDSTRITDVVIYKSWPNATFLQYSKQGTKTNWTLTSEAKKKLNVGDIITISATITDRGNCNAFIFAQIYDMLPNNEANVACNALLSSSNRIAPINVSEFTNDANYVNQTQLEAHTNNTSNPHRVTKTQVGLGNVDNTSDLAKPISLATQEALDKKQNTLIPNGNVVIDNIEQYNLPDEYTQLSALVFYGEQYVDLGVVGTQDTSYEVIFGVDLESVSSIDTKGTVLFGSRSSATSNNISTIVPVPQTSGIFTGVNDFGDYKSTRQTFTVVDKHKYKVYNSAESRSVTDLYTNNSTSITTSFTTNFETPTNLYLGYVEAGGFVAGQTNFIGKVYSVKVWQSENLIRHLVPCKNNVGIIGFYDLINNTFYENAGTGTFGSIENGDLIFAQDTTYIAGDGINIDKDGVISNTHVSGEWGKITGTLANQTDLKNALDAKANTTDIPVNVSELTNDSGYITASSNITGNAATATKLANKRTIALTGDVTGSGSFDGSANLSMSTTVVGNLHNHGVNQIKTQDESGYNWTAGSIDMITRQSIGSARSNKSFNLPAEQIIIEYSQDGGQTWVEYPCTDEEKRGLFTETRQKIFYLGGSNDINAKTLDWQLRVTVLSSYTKDNKTYYDRYVTVDGIYMWASTSGNKFYYTLEKALNGTPDVWTEVFTDQQLSGWSGNNIRYMQTSSWGSTAASNAYGFRMTFYMKELSSGYASSTVSDIRLLGVGYYSGGNEIVKNDRLFKIDTDLNAEFPSNVKADLFEGPSTSTKAVEWQQGTANTASYVWFSDSTSTTAKGVPVWTTKFKYNPTSDTLTVGNITGNAATATNATTHIADTNVHVTTANKATWNAKQDALSGSANIDITDNVVSLTGIVPNDNLPGRLREFNNNSEAKVSSADSATKSGFWQISSGSPFTTGNGDFALSVNAFSATYVCQIAQCYYGNQLAYRVRNSGVWTDWRLVAWADEVALKQDKLTAGEGIIISDDNEISVSLTSVPWGNITGDISQQADLMGVLSNKQNKLVAGTNMEVSGANISTTATRITIRDWSDL